MGRLGTDPIASWEEKVKEDQATDERMDADRGDQNPGLTFGAMTLAWQESIVHFAWQAQPSAPPFPRNPIGRTTRKTFHATLAPWLVGQDRPWAKDRLAQPTRCREMTRPKRNPPTPPSPAPHRAGVRSAPGTGKEAALRERLEELIRRHPPTDRVPGDPVSFPRAVLAAGGSRQEVEAVALLAAMLAYGAVPLFMRVTRQILEETAYPPPLSLAAPGARASGRRSAVKAGSQPPFTATRVDREDGVVPPRTTHAAKECLQTNGFLAAITQPGGPRFTTGYRLSTAAEISRFGGAIGAVISQHGGLWEAFAPGWRREGTVRAGLVALHGALWQALGCSPAAAPGGLRHLLPDPAGGGCCKRWQMFLRWMVRPDDGVDLGQWPAVPPSALLMPLDRHISRLARHLGFTRRATDDWKTAEEVTAALRRLDPADPVRYDFSLCHLAIAGDCTHGRDPSQCAACALAGFCLPPRTKAR